MFYSLTEMRGAAMSLTAAASGLVVFLLSVSVVQGQDVWGVTYSSTEICAVKGSTVEINCRYTYPSRWRGGVNTVEKTFWFTKQKDGEPVDLRTDSEYAGRVETLCKNNICTLRIRNLRESDSAQYRFKFKTNQEGFEGSPGVTLSVTDLQVTSPSNRLYCQSRCPHSSNPSYIWYKNGQIIQGQTSYHTEHQNNGDSYSCALKGHEDFPSPPVYAPKLPSVSVSPSAEIEEGSSVTLTCSSDANPAANYTWYKENEDSPKASGQIFTITDFRAEHSGSYSCEAQNKLGRSNSTLHLTVGTGSSRMMVNIIRTTLGVLILIPVFLLSLWKRKNKAVRSSTGAHTPEEIELDSVPEYEDVSHTAAQTEDPEEQEDMV
ncbi:carcinoembryonic antigen-related cell adhesion molecule 1-like isoform X1 [Eleginops maclovinus]|uniref:carcinoembryonic antigen-related cell adhesion molecule 1-like isoform X1 n=2 Tax=Eleginops maclovinus TaxID=56733 RepID=UPI003080CFDE